MKENRFGRARVLSSDQMDLLHHELPEGVHRIVAQICRRTSCRVSEALKLRWRYVLDEEILLTARTVKGGKRTRSIPLHPVLKKHLLNWREVCAPLNGPDCWVCPGRNPYEPLTRQSFDYQMRQATKRLELAGVSTHSFRRSALTEGHKKGIGLRTLQALSGHRNLQTIAAYIEIDDQQKRDAVNAFS
jgi:integrase/recombinase XerD